MISTQQFKKLLAEYANVSEAEASAFVEAMLQTVLTHVKQGETVTIQGLGTFKVLDSQQGELRRLAFVCDEKLREAVNSPFSFFEPMVIERPKAEPAKEEEPSEPVMEEEPSELIAEEEPQIPVTVEEPEVSVAEKEPEISVAEETNPPVSQPVRKSRTLDVVNCILAVIVIALLWYLFGAGLSERQPMVLEDAEISETTEPLETPEPSATDEIAEARPAPPTDNMLLHENGEPKTVTLKEGERLALLAERLYGDKVFWCYIFDVNAYRLTNPDQVPTGVSLYLPDPTYFNIDADDPASVRRARNHGAKLLIPKQ